MSDEERPGDRLIRQGWRLMKLGFWLLVAVFVVGFLWDIAQQDY